MTLFIGILEEGLIYAIMALGVYITYKILDFPDLSVDSTFPMGAALTASAILAGINPVLTLCLWRRGTGRLRDGSDPRQIKGQRLALRYHCHDRTVFFKLTDGWRPRQCADLQPGDHF